MKLIAISFAALSLAAPAALAMNKCTSPDGKIVFQDRPCAAEQATSNQQAPQQRAPQGGNVMPISEITKNLNSQVQRKLDDRANAVPQVVRPPEELERGKVLPGMEAAAVLAAWGKPSQINKTTTATSVREQWVYFRGRASTDYVYLVNGVTTSVQMSN